MHLEELGKISEATTMFNNLIKDGNGSNLVFANTLKGLSTQSKINVVAQTELNKTQKIGILTTAGLTGEELKQVITTNALSASQEAATKSTTSLSTAFKGLGVQIQKAITAHSYIAVAAAILANYT